MSESAPDTVHGPLSVARRYRNAIVRWWHVDHGTGPVSAKRPDLPAFQAVLFRLYREFAIIADNAISLDLFSATEPVAEISVRALPFLNIAFYLGQIYSRLLTDPRGTLPPDDLFAHKLYNLRRAQKSYCAFLWSLNDHGVLLKEQARRLLSLSDPPTTEELRAHEGSAQATRQAKIDNYKSQKQLLSQLAILDEYYEKHGENDDDTSDIYLQLDEEVVARIFRDQLTLHSLQAFSALELVTMEMDVLQRRPPNSLPPPASITEDSRQSVAPNDSGYTTRLESRPVPPHLATASDLVSPQGKILRPFTITSNREQIKAKVMGTGQVLPSMLVEQYLDYELANGKMAAPAVPDTRHDDSDALDSDEEQEARRWDDWKDDHPKGLGNTKANIG